MSEKPLDYICCPQCGDGLIELSCKSCQVTYPCFQQIPWLIPQPKAAFQYWRATFLETLESLRNQAQALRLQSEAKSNLTLTTKRLRKLSQAKYEQVNLLENLLAGLDEEVTNDISLTEGLYPKQDLTSYIDNIHRDWSWGDIENEESLNCLKEVMEGVSVSDKNVLFLGAGSGRLAYDFHLSFKPAKTILSDINPLLLSCAKKIISGEKIKLYDFPIAPKSLALTQSLNKLQAPQTIKEGISFLFIDALNIALEKNSIDIIITPWLIDILPGDPEELMRAINKVLKPGGHWINFGPLGFTHQESRFHFSKEEVFEGLESSGFKLHREIKKQIPYMQNPSSQHGRIEETLSFCAERIKEVDSKEVEEILPDWLINTKVPIPKLGHFENLKATHGISHQVFSQINGGNSLEEMAKNLAPKFGLNESETLESLKRFMRRNLS